MFILNSIQSREYKRAQALAGLFTAEDKVCNLYQPFSDEVASFSLNNKKLLDLVPDKDSNGDTITEEKGGLKSVIATSANIICTRTAAYAIKIGDKDLQAAVYHSTTEIRKLRDADVLGFATRLAATVSPLLANAGFLSYNVTADMVTALTDNATSFNESIGKAALADSKKSYVSEVIDDVLKAIRGNIVQFSLLLNFFEENHPGFIKDYRTAVAINDSGIHHNGIKGIITNGATGKSVEDVSVVLQGKKKTKTTTTGEGGAFEIIKFMAGKGKLIITAPGYDSQAIAVNIIRGRIIECNIELQAHIISLTATA